MFDNSEINGRMKRDESDDCYVVVNERGLCDLEPTTKLAAGGGRFKFAPHVAATASSLRLPPARRPAPGNASPSCGRRLNPF